MLELILDKRIDKSYIIRVYEINLMKYEEGSYDCKMNYYRRKKHLSSPLNGV